AVRSAAFPAPTGPLGAGAPPEAVRAAAPDAPLAGRGALGTGARSAARAPPMVAGEEAPAEQPAASAQAPAASRKACVARRRDGETQARCTRAIMPIGRQHRLGGSHGNVTTWQLYWPRGADPRSPPVAGAPVPSSRELGRVGPGSDPPEPPGGRRPRSFVTGAWPCWPGERPPEPPGGRRPRSFVTGAWPCWPGGATPGFRGLCS